MGPVVLSQLSYNIYDLCYPYIFCASYGEIWENSDISEKSDGLTDCQTSHTNRLTNSVTM